MHRLIMLLAVTSICLAPLPADDLPPIKPIERRIPPPGVDIGDEARAKIQTRLDALDERYNALRKGLHKDEEPDRLTDPLTDAEVYLKAVRFALMHGEFYAKGDVEKAMRTLDTAAQRIDTLAKNETPWATQRGRIVRGYRSDIDGSVQPYGLEIPEKLDLSGDRNVPLYIWLHGRGDKVTDLHFIAQREKSGCPISPFVDDGIIVHPFGRHCVGYKGPGEIDVLDVIESVKKRYPIDEDRVALLGFSMGGAGAWHIGAHYADQFCVVHAGAGFAETKEYIGLKKENYPPWYEQKLWGVYDVPNYVRNLFNTTVVAYSGENDKQIQAARVMERAFAAHGRKLHHIIGPGMGHKYHPESIKEVMAVVKAAVKKGREKWPKEVHLQTRTLRYNRMHWVEIKNLINHWDEARIDAKVVSPTHIEVTVKNVSRFKLHSPWRDAPRDKMIDVVINGVHRREPAGGMVFVGDGKQWVDTGFLSFGNAKEHRQSGPIDDVFLKPFLVVQPTRRRASSHPKVERWVRFELEHFMARWRALYRGEPRIKYDIDVTDDDLRRFNIIAWGDPNTNVIIRRCLHDLPFTWKDNLIVIGDERYDSHEHVPMCITAATREVGGNYIVLNSGPTHREAHDRTNSLQNPKLPDWAIVSLERDPDAASPGVIKAAGFFDGNWKVKVKVKEKE